MASTKFLDGVTVNKLWQAYNGFTLYSPLGAKQVLLINMKGDVVHKWEMSYPPALYGELLPNGNLLYAGYVKDGPLADMEGAGGVLLEVDWDGKIVWEYENPYLHHAFYRMSNGNTMVLKWEEIPKDISDKVQGGLPGTEREGVIWGDCFQEIDPQGNIVWEWKAFEHLGPSKYAICPLCTRDEWTQANSCNILQDGNLLTSFRRTNNICIVNKPDGSIKWQWGLHEISHPNCATILENGNVLLFDNGIHADGLHEPFSRVIEVEPYTNKMVWAYRDKWNENTNFYSGFMSSCQRLPNGNTLITETSTGRIFEVNRDGEIVWEFINPEYTRFLDYGNNNAVPRAIRYGADYIGLKGQKDLKLGKLMQTEIDIERNKSKKDKDKSKEDKEKSAVESRLEQLGY